MKHPAEIKTNIFSGTLFLAACLASVSQLEANPSNTGQPFPEVRIPDHAKGPQVIEALGENLPAVAKFYGFSADDFRELVRHDHSVSVDESGKVFHVCEGLVADEAAVINADTTSFTIASGADAFSLASRPGAALTILLDFDGHTTSGTLWNNRTGGADFYTPAYDTDGNASAFSSTERSNIVEIWKRVAEDFAVWDVNVTTIDPGQAALVKSSSSDSEYGIRVAIGGSSNDWYGASAGGVAYLGSFNWTTDTPCYAFEAQLGNGNVKYTAEAISHEVGHTLSLYHDGTTTGDAYYRGHGDWAPIMGVGYYEPIVQWSKGDYANPNNTEDDVAKITSYIPLRSDLVADDMTTDSILGLEPIVGIIESEVDADIFGFQTDGGTLNISASAANAGNLDIRLALYDAYGDLILSGDPSGLNASISTSLTAGSYYLLVEGTSPGNPTTAYNDYGSIGQYQLVANFTTSQNQAPVAVASTNSPTVGRNPLTVNFLSTGSYDSDGTIASYDWNFGDGASSAAQHPSHTYTTAGVFTASLVVVDDKGASTQDSIVITVTEPVAPVADASRTTPTSGTAPLTVNLNGTGSSDPDGNITAFNWTVSDGTALSGSQSAYTFNTPGTYTVTLSVVDNEGLSDSETITITVEEAPTLSPLYAVDQTVSVSGNSKKGYTAFADLKVVDENGKPVQGAIVTGQFSGGVNETSTTNSGRRGDVSFRSSKFRNTNQVTFQVVEITLDGFIYVP